MMSITNVIYTPSIDIGAVLYHLLLLLVTEVVAVVALVRWRTAHGREHHRVFWMFSAASIIQILPLANALFRLPSLSPVVSSVDLLTLSFVAWAVTTALPDYRIGRLPLIGLLVSALVCSAMFLPAWSAEVAKNPEIAYESFWQQSFWYAVSLIVALLAAIALFRTPRQARCRSLGMGFALVCISFLIRLANTFLPAQSDIQALVPATFIAVLPMILTILSGLGQFISVAGYSVLALAYCRSTVEDYVESRKELQSASEEALRRTQELLFIVETSQAIGKSLDLDTILSRVVENVASTLDADRCAIILADTEHDRMFEVAAHYTPLLHGVQPSSKQTATFGEQPAFVTALRRHTQLVLQPSTDASLLKSVHTLLDSPQMGPMIIQPLVRQQRALGLLIVGNDHCQRPFTSDEGQLTQSIAAQVASAIDNARLYRALATQTHQLADLLQLQKANSRQQSAILESITEAVIVSDQGGQIGTVNAAAEKILGIARQRIQGLPLEQMAEQISLGPSVNWQAVIRSETPLQTVFNLKNRIVHLDSAPVVTSEGKRLGTVSILHDITTETETERAKSDFITVASHELRTPLTAIRGYTEALSSGMAGKVTETQNHFLRIIHDNALRMANLTENIIAVSEIEKKFLRLDYEHTDLHLLIGDVVVSFKNQLEDRQLEMHLDLDPSLPLVDADAARIRQILGNLVSNAIKFTYPGGRITIGARGFQEDDRQPPAQYAIWVSDTGIGIPPQEQARIWERFCRTSNPLAEDASGLGMGLSIVKSLTEAHGGRVWLESTPGVGSTFTILLPARRVRPTDQLLNTE